jgi:hypothetical protein
LETKKPETVSTWDNLIDDGEDVLDLDDDDNEEQAL